MACQFVCFGPGGEVLRRAAACQKAARGFERARGSTWSFAAVLPDELGEGHVQGIGTAMAGPTSGQALFLIVPWRTPPVSGYRDDGCVRWFGVSSAAAGCLRGVRLGDPASIYRLLYRFALKLTPADRLGMVQFGRPAAADEPRPASPARVAAVVPHLGRLDHLRSAVNSLCAQETGAEVEVAVGLDRQDCGEADLAAAEGNGPRVRVFEACPTGVGHFAIRQALIDKSEAGFIALQDSDDLSCSNRIEVCRAALLGESGADIVGCHEVRLDEMRHLVTLRRYPLDVNRALASDGRGGILHGTMFARREALAAAGGFSTRLKFAADTQFKLRASLLLKLRNVDEFLYVRRIHAGSLTSRPETRLGSPARERLRTAWERDEPNPEPRSTRGNPRFGATAS